MFFIACPRHSDVFVLQSKGKNREPGSRDFFVRKNTCDDKNNKIWAGGEMVDTLALGASAARHGGSSPLLPTD